MGRFLPVMRMRFHPRIKGLGPVTAHKLMQQYGTSESILNSDALDKQSRSMTPPADVASYLTDIEAARAIYLTPMTVDDITKEELQLQDEGPNIKSIMRGLDLNLDRIEMRSGFEGTPLDNEKHSWELISKKPLDLQVWISLSRKDKDSQQPCQTTMFIDARSPDRSRTFSSGILLEIRDVDSFKLSGGPQYLMWWTCRYRRHNG